MTVTLQPLTRDNLWAVVELQLHPGQEAFVAPNIDSIANAYVEPTFVPLAVYAGDDAGRLCHVWRAPRTGHLVGDPADDRLGASGPGLRPGGDGGGDRHDDRAGRLRGNRDQLQSRRMRSRPDSTRRSASAPPARSRTASRWCCCGSPIGDQTGDRDERPRPNAIAGRVSMSWAVPPASSSIDATARRTRFP